MYRHGNRIRRDRELLRQCLPSSIHPTVSCSGVRLSSQLNAVASISADRSVNQVQQGEQIDPDQVDQVPIQADIVDRPVVLLAEMALDGTP